MAPQTLVKARHHDRAGVDERGPLPRGDLREVERSGGPAIVCGGKKRR